jgi:hypothetical protein
MRDVFESPSRVILNDIGIMTIQVLRQIPCNRWRGTMIKEENSMLKNTMRGVLGLILTAAATWLANYIVDRVFGPDEQTA